MRSRKVATARHRRRGPARATLLYAMAGWQALVSKAGLALPSFALWYEWGAGAVVAARESESLPVLNMGPESETAVSLGTRGSLKSTR
jgi:hypothetical protein